MKAGFGKADITPRLGVQLAGYGPYRNRAAKEIVTPLFARALVVEQGRKRAVLLSLELGGTPRRLSERIRTAVAARIGGKATDVMISATHTHSSPAVGGMYAWGEADMLYLETLPARAAEAAVQAVANLTEVEWRHAHAPCEGIAVNRDTDTGFALNENFSERMNPAWRPAKPEHTDPTVRVLTAYAGGKLVGLLHHFGCHPVVYGEKTAAIHGDYAGVATLALEKKFPGATALFFPGALGDINPKLNHRVIAESRRALKAIAKQYAAAVVAAVRGAEPILAKDFAVLRRDATFARQRWSRAKVDRQIADLEAFFATPGRTDTPFVGDTPLTTNGMKMARLQGLRAVRADFRGATPPNPSVCVHGLRIGPVALLGCGLEVYHSLQASVLAGSPHAHNWVISLVGGTGYAPDRAATERAGYAGDFVPLVTGELPYARVYDELPRALVKLARDLR